MQGKTKNCFGCVLCAVQCVTEKLLFVVCIIHNYSDINRNIMANMNNDEYSVVILPYAW